MSHRRIVSGILYRNNTIKMKMDYIKPEITGNELRLQFLTDELVFANTSFILEFIEKTVHAAGANRIILDLGNVKYIDSSAAGMFISLKNDMRKSGKRLILEGLTVSVRRILHFLDVTGYLDLDAA